MAKGGNDVSVGHFQWLVDGRSDNQRTTLRLYEIIEQNEQKLNKNVELQMAAQELTSIAFSLWRAVFLSDTTGEFKDQLADVKKFLISLISDNAVLYITDKNARNWSFRYYLDNAKYRLQTLTNTNLNLIAHEDLQKSAASEKDEWINAQSTLDTAVNHFGDAVQKTP